MGQQHSLVARRPRNCALRVKDLGVKMLERRLQIRVLNGLELKLGQKVILACQQLKRIVCLNLFVNKCLLEQKAMQQGNITLKQVRRIVERLTGLKLRMDENIYMRCFRLKRNVRLEAKECCQKKSN